MDFIRLNQIYIYNSQRQADESFNKTFRTSISGQGPVIVTVNGKDQVLQFPAASLARTRQE